MRRFLRLAPALTAMGFTLGAIEHAAGFGLASLGIIASPPYYPPWRHLVMSGADLTIAAVAVWRPDALVFLLTAFLVEQVATNGRFALGEWVRSGVVHKLIIVMLGLEAVAVWAAAMNRWWPPSASEGGS